MSYYLRRGYRKYWNFHCKTSCIKQTEKRIILQNLYNNIFKFVFVPYNFQWNPVLISLIRSYRFPEEHSWEILERIVSKLRNTKLNNFRSRPSWNQKFSPLPFSHSVTEYLSTSESSEHSGTFKNMRNILAKLDHFGTRFPAASLTSNKKSMGAIPLFSPSNHRTHPLQYQTESFFMVTRWSTTVPCNPQGLREWCILSFNTFASWAVPFE